MTRVTAVIMLALIFGGCDRHKEVHVVETYAEAMQRSGSLATVAPDSAAESEALARLQDFLSEMTAERIRSDIRDVYAPDVFMNDTLRTLEGVDEVEEYLLETVARTSFVRVRFDDIARSGGDYYLRWFMEYQSDRINGGNVVESIGMTHIRFNADGRVILHQDYWDSGDGLFGRVPVVGWMIRSLKSRM